MGDLTNFLSGGQQGAYSNYANSLGNIIPQLQQFYQQGQSQLSPYQQAGASAIPQYQNFLNGLMNQTNGNWVNQYQESPYAQYLTNTNLNSMNNAAAATGTLGSGANQQQNAQMASQIAGQDMQNYFNNNWMQNQNILGGLNSLMGTGANAANTGAWMSSNLGNNIASILAGQAAGNANSQMAGSQGKDSGIGGLFGAISDIPGLSDALPFAEGSVI